jgi:IclR family KDG regulon transcriptional repressor
MDSVDYKSRERHVTAGRQSMKDPSIYNVRVIDRAMLILSCFDDEHPERGVSEIAQLVGLHKATAHRIIVTLLNGGYLERAADGEKYRLGLRLAEIGLGVLRRLDYRREAIPHMKTLEERFEETCDLCVFSRGEALYLEVVQSRHALRIAARPGQRLPAYCTASGKVFLAFLEPQEVESIIKGSLRRYTETTITSHDEIVSQLDEIRARGYGVDYGEYEVGVRAVAAPIRDSAGHVVAVLSIVGPATRIVPQRIPEIAAGIIEAANDISARMGWSQKAAQF